MNGVVLLSCYAIKLLHTSSGSISGWARCGNSITLPLPNLVAKLALRLRSTLCGHHSAIQMKAVFFFFSQINCSSCRSPSFIRVFLTFIVQTYIHMFGDSLCKVNICHLLPDVHRLSSIDFILRVCVYHSACPLQPKPEIWPSSPKEFKM